MKTTIDLPDDVFRRAKVTAAQRRTTFKQLVVEGLEMAMEQAPDTQSAIDSLIEAVDVGRNDKPVGRLRREEIYDRPILRRH